MAYLHFLLNERDLFLLEAEKALALNPNSPFLTGYLGWLLALYGEWDRGLAILAKGVELNPHYPGWFHIAPFFYFYRRGKYLEAHQEAQQLQMPQLFWDPLLRAAALGQLGERTRCRPSGGGVASIKAGFLYQWPVPDRLLREKQRSRRPPRRLTTGRPQEPDGIIPHLPYHLSGLTVTTGLQTLIIGSLRNRARRE